MTKSLGEQIRQARKRAKLSQTVLGERARLDQALVSKYETGDRWPPVEHLIRLAQATRATFKISGDTT